MKQLLDNLHVLLTGVVRADQSSMYVPITAFAGGLSLVLGWDRYQELPSTAYPALVVEPYGQRYDKERKTRVLVISVDVLFRVQGNQGVLYGSKYGGGILDAVTDFIAWIREHEQLAVNGVPYTYEIDSIEEVPSVELTTKKKIGVRYSNIVIGFRKVWLE